MSRPIHGLRAWILQRLSALYLAGFAIFAAFHFVVAPAHSYEQWLEWVGSPVVSVAIALFFATLLIHAWVGIRDVVIDYVHPIAVRAATLALLGTGLLACGLWAARILIRAIR